MSPSGCHDNHHSPNAHASRRSAKGRPPLQTLQMHMLATKAKPHPCQKLLTILQVSSCPSNRYKQPHGLGKSQRGVRLFQCGRSSRKTLCSDAPATMHQRSSCCHILTELAGTHMLIDPSECFDGHLGTLVKQTLLSQPHTLSCPCPRSTHKTPPSKLLSSRSFVHDKALFSFCLNKSGHFSLVVF